jgi:hypothetical protein
MVPLFLPLYASSQDTTYGNVQPSDKEHSPPQTQPADQNHIHSNNDDTNSLFGCLFEEAIGGLVKGIFYIYGEPIVKIISSDELDNGKKSHQFSLSTGTAFILYPGIAAGMQFQFDALEYLNLTNHFSFSVKTGVEPSWMGIYKDFKRNVYVNGTSIGTMKDESKSYFNMLIPVQGYIHFFPTGQNGSFNIYAGYGINLIYENLKAQRTTTYNSLNESTSISNSSFIPSLSIGLGRLVEGNKVTGNFSVEYSIFFNKYRHTLSLPSDNTRFLHTIALHWALLL